MGGGPAKEHVLLALPFPVPKAILERLHKKFPAWEFEHRATVPKEAWRDVTVVFTFRDVPPSLDDAPKLSLIQLASAGSNQLQNTPVYKESDITITTATGIHGPQIAEWTVMTALVQSHKYNTLYEMQKLHRWGKTPNQDDAFRQVRDMVGRRIGVLGYGSIGRQVGHVAKAMGMQVVAFTATPKDTPEKKRDEGFIVPGTGDPEGEFPVEWYSGLDKDSLHHFLKQDLDWLLVSVPLTDQTRHMLSTKEFEVLSQGGKKPAFVSNIARGPIIDQPALIEALKDGTLAGAALDVTDPEPLPSDSELWDLPNVVVTPHVSGVGTSYTERSFLLFEQNLERKEKGLPLMNVVRRERGY